MSKKLLLYCTKSKPYLYFENDLGEDEYGMIYDPQWLLTTDSCFNKDYAVNGKIVAECDFEVSKIELHPTHYNYGPAYFTKRQKPFKYFSYIDLLLASCMQDNEMLKYLGHNNGYAIHLKNLHIFDQPKELNDYSKRIKNDFQVLGKAPQNMMKCVSLFTTQVLDYVLISIHPKWLCKILNGEKTIEVRKKVLKEIKND